MGQTHDSPTTQNAYRLSLMPHCHPCGQTHTEQTRRSPGEPCDMKVSSTVRWGLFGKGAKDATSPGKLPNAEIEIGVFERACLQRRVASFDTLRQRVAALEAQRNAALATIDWRFATTDARTKLARLYPKLETDTVDLV